MDEINLQNYHSYLMFISEKLEKFFESQKPYIFCYKGCGKCCKNAMFPYSKAELDYLLLGAIQLDSETQDLIQTNIRNVLARKKKYRGKQFKYDCPFLINNECAVYNHRGVVCRAFGLMTNPTNSEGGKKAPFCCFKGLNYSNVINKRTKMFSPRKAKKLGDVPDACSFNVDYNYLTDADFERGFNFKFGEKKPLIDWFEGIGNSDEDVF